MTWPAHADNTLTGWAILPADTFAPGPTSGPYVIKTDATGKVLRSEIALRRVRSPDDPKLGAATPNIGSSRGFEGMALNASGTKLYTLLEGTVTGDPAKSLRINELDLASESFTSGTALYQLDARRTNSAT